MKLSDFKIGEIFICGEKEWLCTDIGGRIVTAICLTAVNPENLIGPPYGVVEYVFDEYDHPGCETK